MRQFRKLYRKVFKKSLLASRLSRGFTLVELAIVLVIIGIILGAILKGQDLINNARIKRTLNDIRGLEAVVWSFYDRYGRFPGDCNKDGIIDANYVGNGGEALLMNVDNNPASGFCTSTAPDFEPDRPFAELKQAQLLSADADTRDIVKSAFGYLQLFSVTNDTVTVNAIVVKNVPCYVARAIDIAIDKTEDAGSGRIRAFNFGDGTNKVVDDANTKWVGGTGTNCGAEDDNTTIVYLFDKQL